MCSGDGIAPSALGFDNVPPVLFEATGSQSMIPAVAHQYLLEGELHDLADMNIQSKSQNNHTPTWLAY